MKTYKTYQEAKIDNPDCDIFVNRANHFVKVKDAPTDHFANGWKICKPEDYCMTVEQFLDGGHKIAEGDFVFSLIAYGIFEVDAQDVDDWNSRDGHDNKRYILRAAELENQMNIDKVETQSEETMQPRAKHFGVKTQTPEEKEALDNIGGSKINLSELASQYDVAQDLIDTTPHQYEMGKLKLRDYQLDEIKATAWNGEGLPPVGVECEFVCHDKNKTPHNKHHGEVMDCVAHTGLSNGLAVLVSKDLSFATVCNDAWIKKPESPEAKEKREKLEAAYDLYCLWGNAESIDATLLSMHAFKGLPLSKKWLAIVDKTNYRKGE